MPKGRVIHLIKDTKPWPLFQIQQKHDFFSGGAAWIASHSDRDGHKVQKTLDGKSRPRTGFYA